MTLRQKFKKRGWRLVTEFVAGIECPKHHHNSAEKKGGGGGAFFFVQNYCKLICEMQFSLSNNCLCESLLNLKSFQLEMFLKVNFIIQRSNLHSPSSLRNKAGFDAAWTKKIEMVLAYHIDFLFTFLESDDIKKRKLSIQQKCGSHFKMREEI